MIFSLSVVVMERNVLVMDQAVQQIPGRKMPWGGVPYVIQSTSSLTSSSFVQVGTLPQYVGQWKNVTSSWFASEMVRGHHLLFRCYPLFQ